MGKILVGYATGTGCTAAVAERIGTTLSAAGAQVDVLSFDNDPRPEDYDAVVMGSGVRAGSWHPVAKKWVRRHAETLKGMPVALFTVCIALAEGPEQLGEALGYTDKLLASTGVKPLSIGPFAGRYYAEEFNPIVRAIMKRKGAAEGDFRDWRAIETWARRVASLLVKQEAVAVA